MASSPETAAGNHDDDSILPRRHRRMRGKKGATAIAASRSEVAPRETTTPAATGVSSDAVETGSLFDTLGSVSSCRERDGRRPRHDGPYRSRVGIDGGRHRCDGGETFAGVRSQQTVREGDEGGGGDGVMDTTDDGCGRKGIGGGIGWMIVGMMTMMDRTVSSN